jgi:hypothetical protein
LIICQTFQLHDEKRKREDLRRILLDVSTIKANEILSDICVVQSESRDKFIVKSKKIAKESTRLVTFIKSKKTMKESISFATSIEKTHREKRRQFENESTIQTKRFKRDELVEKDEKSVIHVFDDSDVKFRKTRAQTRKKILKELKNVIAVEKQKIEKLENESQTFKKSFTMSDELTARSSKKQTSKSTSFVKSTSVFEKRLTIFKDSKSQSLAQNEHDVLITSFNVLATEFFTMNEAVIKLRKTRNINAFLTI